MPIHGPIRCMAEGRDEQWWATCLDFDIAVDGESFAAVRESLQKAIDMYLERVAELPQHEQAQFLRRRAPWHLRAKFHLLSLLEKIRGRRGGRHREFVITSYR